MFLQGNLLTSMTSRVAIVSLLVVPTIGKAADADLSRSGGPVAVRAAHYVYHGQNVGLPLDRERLAVKYRADTTPAARAAGAASVGVTLSSSRPTGVGRWHLLRPETTLEHESDASRRITALLEAPAPVLAVSPVVGGAALRGPAARMLRSLGGTASAAGVVEHYRQHHRGLVDTWVLDELDAAEVPALEASGVPIELLPTVMRTYDDRRRLAQAILDAHMPT